MYPFDEFLNDYDEIHSLWFGFCTVIIPSANESVEEKKVRELEPQYYKLGEILGIALIFVVTRFSLPIALKMAGG